MSMSKPANYPPGNKWTILSYIKAHLCWVLKGLAPWRGLSQQGQWGASLSGWGRGRPSVLNRGCSCSAGVLRYRWGRRPSCVCSPFQATSFTLCAPTSLIFHVVDCLQFLPLPQAVQQPRKAWAVCLCDKFGYRKIGQVIQIANVTLQKKKKWYIFLPLSHSTAKEHGSWFFSPYDHFLPKCGNRAVSWLSGVVNFSFWLVLILWIPCVDTRTHKSLKNELAAFAQNLPNC